MYKPFKSAVALLLTFSLAIGPVTAQELSNLADDLGPMDDALGEALDTTVSGHPSVQVHLKDDGSFAGRFRVVWPTGKTEPAQAEVRFAAGDAVTESTTTNETGHFVLEGLAPGKYVATASIQEGSTDFDVEVLPHDEDAQPREMFMDATLTPMPEYVEGDIVVETATCSSCGGELVGGYCDACGLFHDELVDPCGCGEDPCCCEEMYPPMCGGFGGGCCGGGYAGGGGLGWLLGAAGLAAGLASLVDDDDDNQPASPVSP